MLGGFLLAGVGFALVVAGRRGFAIDDHRICGRCGYDVHRISPQTRRCPECGQMLVPAKIRIGNRVPWPRMAWFGCALLLSGLLWGGMQAYYTIGHRYNDYKPTWWLRREAQHRDYVRSNAAIRELAGRAQGGHLSQQTMSKLMDQALDVQKNQQWHEAWGILVYELIGQNAASQKQINGFVGESFGTVDFEAPTRCSQNEPFDWAFKYQDWMLVDNAFEFELWPTLQSLAVDGVPVQLSTTKLGRTFDRATGVYEATSYLPVESLEPGMHTLTVSVRGSLVRDGNVLGSRVFSASHKFQLLPATDAEGSDAVED